ncbi:hypothetical protein [Halocynthiibacter namhaensis]|uniref:hypothetical protein n=1 Tax=Halocynthiibacter namhaensis TaxID=1290553 RepID=UPI0005794002|nr:hypothetical protein [Halocynthiibacter namhaensis]
MTYFEYLQGLLGNNDFACVLNQKGTGIDREKIAKIDLKTIPLGFLTATTHAKDESWEEFNEHVCTKLKLIDSATWSTHIEAMDHTARPLVEKLSTSGCSLDSSKFRGPLQNLILGVLSEEITPTTDQGAIDILMTALDESCHADIWRTIREKITDVTPESLAAAFHLFPTLLSDFVQRGRPITAGEKDKIIRYILCSALEGRNREVLEIFVQMEYSLISRFKRSSNDSTNTLLDGAMKSFSDSDEDRNWIRTVSEAIMGKKRTKTMWDVWFGA